MTKSELDLIQLHDHIQAYIMITRETKQLTSISLIQDGEVPLGSIRIPAGCCDQFVQHFTDKAVQIHGQTVC